MTRIKFLLVCLIQSCVMLGQTTASKLENALRTFENDPQLKHAISSIYVIEAGTGRLVFEKNSQLGLAGASTQKVITAATAFDMLGSDYRYQTEFWWARSMTNYSKSEVVVVKPSGDPTLGSWRYFASTPGYILEQIRAGYQQNGLNPEKLSLTSLYNNFSSQVIPDGWIMQDIGNYYGAGAAGFNWRENQSDIILSSGKTGDPVKLVATDTLAGTGFVDNQLITAAKNTGDNAYYYFLYGNHHAGFPTLRGTIPEGEKNFKISIAVAEPYVYFLNELKKNKLLPATHPVSGIQNEVRDWKPVSADKLIYRHLSPGMDSIIYWFLKKSINLYGEALIKTLAMEKVGKGATDSGVSVIRDFWKSKGLDPDELNMYDGSGLSPLNRITTHAQVEVLKYAKSRKWFPYFFDALPEYNGMKMKSGTISDVKGYCGYHKSADGQEYIFSFLVNNYTGRSSTLVQKMFKVLDALK
jgi:serine-type D-Ala-D-Ala carboxypeptidase/endopeptidase (penicillin-binding protein 4)